MPQSCWWMKAAPNFGGLNQGTMRPEMYGLEGHWSSWYWPPAVIQPRPWELPTVNTLAKEIALYYYEGCLDNYAPLPMTG